MDYLNLGCGYYFHSDWTNVDFVSTGAGVIAHNLREGIPFPEESFDVIYHSHVLEHFPKTEAGFFLEECFRVLRPGGILRVVVPDLEQMARLYLTSLEKTIDGSKEWAANYEWILLEMYDQAVRHHSGGEMAVYLAQEKISNEEFVLKRIGTEGKNLIEVLHQQPKTMQSPSLSLTEQELNLKNLLGVADYQALQIGRFRQSGEVHQWMYDRYSLTKLLNAVGFEQVRVCQADESSIQNFSQYCLDVEPDGQVRKPDSLFVEAQKLLLSEAVSRIVVAKRQRLRQLLQSRAQARLELEVLQTQLQPRQTELEQAQNTIAGIESSKFWKLRKLWFKVKKLLRLPIKE